MASFVYDNARKLFFGSLDMTSDVIKVMLVSSSYVGDPDHVYVEEAANDANEHEISATGYTAGHGNAGRKTLSSITLAADNTNDRGELTAANIEWTAITGTADAAVVHVQGTSDDTDAILIAYIDDGGFPVTLTGGTLRITPNAEGLLQI